MRVSAASKVVKVLVIELSEDVNSRSFSNESMPLHLTSQDGHVKIAQFLVEHGTARVAQDISRMTPLHLASSSGHLDRARFLVEHGADAAAQNNVGETPLHLVSSGGHLDLAWFLVEHGADVAARNKDESTPLHESGHLDLAWLLVEHGANAQNSFEETPLHFASSNGHLDLGSIGASIIY